MDALTYQELLDITSKYDAQLLAVSKTYEQEKIMPIYNDGQRIFGENKVQEILRKKETLPEDIAWHLIGHLQSNKTKKIVGQVAMIQSVDSLKLLKVIQKESEKRDIKSHCLLQIHIAEEDTKTGLDEKQLDQITSEFLDNKFPNIELHGFMGMATFTEDKEKVRKEFKMLRGLYERYCSPIPSFDTLSMGMSGDYKIALDEGSTMIRVGSLIFGDRKY